MNPNIKNITDKEAVTAYKGKGRARAQVADTFATETVLYPVKISRTNGVEETENRPFIIMRQHYPKRKIEEAQEIKALYKELNAQYKADLKAKGLPTFAKDPGKALMDVSPVEVAN